MEEKAVKIQKKVLQKETFAPLKMTKGLFGTQEINLVVRRERAKAGRLKWRLER